MADWNLLPTPQLVTRQGQGLQLALPLALEIVTGSAVHPKVRLAATVLREQLESLVRGSGSVRTTEQSGRADGWIVLIDVERQQARAAELAPADREAIDRSGGQGYVLQVQSPDRVQVWGRPQGILWGAMTLLQLIEAGPDGLRIPGVLIRDFPTFEFRCAADWLANVEANRSTMDRGQGWEGYEALCKRKIDQCLRYKINTILFDGFGCGLTDRPAEYAPVVRRISQYARQRGIHLVFGSYGAGYGMAFQKGPLYEDARYLGRVFENREHYPDGPVYPCTGETRARAVRKGVDTRILGTCRGNDELNRLKAEELQAFVRAVEPGMLYLHHEDYGSVRNTQAAWQWRCERCRRRWPDDDAPAPDGAAGAIAEGYRRFIEAVNRVRNTETGYEAATDCQIVLVSPVYCLSEHTEQAWEEMLRFWRSAARQLPPAGNVMVCFRETFALDGGPSWTESFNAAMREVGANLGAMIFFITGGDHFVNDYPFVGASALDGLFAGARGILHASGTAYQEPLQLLNAEYAWNSRSTGYAPRPDTYIETWDLWIGLCENQVRPEEIHGSAGLLSKACSLLYGDGAAEAMARYFSAFEDLQAETADRTGAGGEQDVAPQRQSYLPMTFNKVHAVPILWRALALDAKTWDPAIDNERMIQEMDRLRIDRPELHRRLRRRWTVTARMLEAGRDLLSQAIDRAASAWVVEELRFLQEAAAIRIPLARALASFHEALRETAGAAAGPPRALLETALAEARQAAMLAERHYPSIVDPVGETGAVRTYVARLEQAILKRVGLSRPPGS